LCIPPISEIAINILWQNIVLMSGTQVTHGFIPIIFAIINLKVRFPPKIFVLERVVVVEEDQVVGQLFAWSS
jgi:hypothetical protein